MRKVLLVHISASGCCNNVK